MQHAAATGEDADAATGEDVKVSDDEIVDITATVDEIDEDDIVVADIDADIVDDDIDVDDIVVADIVVADNDDDIVDVSDIDDVIVADEICGGKKKLVIEGEDEEDSIWKTPHLIRAFRKKTREERCQKNASAMKDLVSYILPPKKRVYLPPKTQDDAIIMSNKEGEFSENVELEGEYFSLKQRRKVKLFIPLKKKRSLSPPSSYSSSLMRKKGVKVKLSFE